MATVCHHTTDDTLNRAASVSERLRRNRLIYTAPKIKRPPMTISIAAGSGVSTPVAENSPPLKYTLLLASVVASGSVNWKAFPPTQKFTVLESCGSVDE